MLERSKVRGSIFCKVEKINRLDQSISLAILIIQKCKGANPSFKERAVIKIKRVIEWDILNWNVKKDQRIKLELKAWIIKYFIIISEEKRKFFVIIRLKNIIKLNSIAIQKLKKEVVDNPQIIEIIKNGRLRYKNLLIKINKDKKLDCKFDLDMFISFILWIKL